MENFRDAELKKWLAEEYEKETEEMEKILFPDGVIPDDGETEEEAKAAYQRLVERLKADGVYKEDETDSIKTDDHKENVKIVYLPEKKSHKAARVAAAVLVCSASIFAASMTSQANRSYFLDSVRYWVGDDTKIVIDNDRKSEKEYEDEQKAIDDIEEKLDIDLPYLMYRPQGFKFKDYNVSKDFEYALLQYDYKDTILTVYVNKYDRGTKSSGASLDGKEIETIKLPEEEISIQVKKIMAKGDKKASYVAYWNNSTEFYQIEAQMEEKEFIKLIQNIKFQRDNVFSTSYIQCNESLKEERHYMKEKMKRIVSLLFLACCCSILFAVPAMAESLSDDFSVETDTNEDYAEDTTYSVLRGNNLSFGTTTIKKMASNKVGISGITQCHHVCDKVYLNVYLERKVNGTYSTYKSWNFTASNASNLVKDITVIVPSGYYYRVRGYHAAKDGSKESTKTLTSGVLVK